MANTISVMRTPDNVIHDISTSTVPSDIVSGTASAFTATTAEIHELVDGACIWLTNNIGTSTANCTLNVNSLGAKPIYLSSGSTRVTTEFTQGSSFLFVYNSTKVSGGCWDLVVGRDASGNPSSTVSSVSTSASAGSSTEYSRGDHTHDISLATGDDNGQVKIAGTNVDVKGLGTAAYTASTDYATASHTHGNITNAGTITSDTTVASGDKIVIVDADDNEVARSSISFDGSTTSKALTQKGTWETFLTSHQSVTDGNPNLTWGTQSTVATIGSTDIHVTMPSNPNTDTKVRQTLATGTTTRPLLLSSATVTDTTSSVDGISYRNNQIFANPANGILYANAISTSSWLTGTGSQLSTGVSAGTTYTGMSLKSEYVGSNGTTYSYNRMAIRTFAGKITSNAGMALAIDSGGLTVVGGGESAGSIVGLIADDQSIGYTLLTSSTAPEDWPTTSAYSSKYAKKIDTSYIAVNGDDTYAANTYYVGPEAFIPGGNLSARYTGSAEHLVLAADNHIIFEVNCNTIANRKPVVLSSDTSFYPGTTETGSIGTSLYYWNTAYIKTINGNLVGNVTGNADTASKINTSAKIGDTNKPVYIAADGTVTAISGTIGSAGLPIYSNNGVLTACSIPASGAWWNTSTPRVPQIGTNGVLEAGRYYDFHATAASANNYDVRFDALSVSQLKLYFQTTSGSYFAPGTTNVTELGTSSAKWKNVNSTTITRTALKGMLTGTGTAASDKGEGVSPRYFPAKWTFNTGLTAADGDVFIIKLPTAGHSYGVFLSVDNGTNYYPISNKGTTRLTTNFGEEYVIAVIFKSDGSTASIYPLDGGDATTTVSGGCWQVLNYDNTTYTPQSLGFGYGTCSTAAATAAKVVTLSSYNLTTNGMVAVKFTYDVPANATMNINSKGAKNIYFRGAKITAGVIKAGDVATFVYSSYYHLISIDRWGEDIGDINTVLEAIL